MKNKSVILGIVIIVLVIFLTGCGFHNVLNKSEFKNHFSALGYDILEDSKGEYESSAYLVAKKDDMPFNIEYYEFENEIEAKKVYEKYKDNISNYITSDSKNNETTSSIFSKIVSTSDNEYIVNSRVKNTLIFIAGTIEYKQEIDTLLEDIEY